MRQPEQINKLLMQVTLDIGSSTAFRSLLQQKVVLTLDTFTEDALVSLMQRLLVDPLLLDVLMNSLGNFIDIEKFPFSINLIVDIVSTLLGRILYQMVRKGSARNFMKLFSDNLFISAGSTLSSYIIQLTSKMPSMGNCCKKSGDGLLM